MRGLEPGDPRSVGRYRILARVGAGGMAIVYLGQSVGGRAVAVKVMHTEFAREPAFRDRFRREVWAARTVGGLYSPAVLDADPEAAMPWLATEFLPSVSLRDAIRNFGALPMSSVWPLAVGLAEALASIHRAGIAHLDLKPANVLLTADGPRVIDFGIADEVRTGPVTPAGSRGFMAPEQVTGTGAGPASDVYAFGSTLVYACTGAQQGGESWVADPALQAMLARCLRPDPTERPTAPELIGYLTSVAPDAVSDTGWLPPVIAAEIDRQVGEAENPPVARSSAPLPRRLNRRALLIGMGAVVVAGGGAGVLVLTSGSPPSAPPTSSPAPVPVPVATSVSAAPKSRALEFYLFGTVTLTDVTYTVNGKATTLHNVPLPWRQAVAVAPSPQLASWRIQYHFPPGEVNWRILIDGFETATGQTSSAGDPSQGDDNGTN
ncbi:MAG: serine/threonine protein kinase [Amycolatopsis sp.]|uniref:serine/threonine-protein kinase n=1 Tax=Amycolatopsis sp. TaxID=37632 RepID=UPI00261B64C6|nr:serine/threonine-protein kinase [Amycolatopsis sp.]MCU1681853.1 serine/threonine protein kinase [Amycolatopsis sp.]